MALQVYMFCERLLLFLNHILTIDDGSSDVIYM